MKLALDTYYYSDKDAYTVGVLFSDWSSSVPDKIEACHTTEFSDYVPGLFYKRELPCIMDLLGKVDLGEIDTIIVDGFVTLPERDGLGMHLWKELGKPGINIIGVAKTKFFECEKIAVPCLRGLESRKPLWVNTNGLVSNEEAALWIKSMYGENRLPDLLKVLDKETKKFK